MNGPPGRESRPEAAYLEAAESFGGDTQTILRATDRPPPARRDEGGLMRLAEVFSRNDGWLIGYREGYAQALADRDADIDAEAARVVDNTARSIRAEPANPYALRGTDAELRAFAAGCQRAERERFRADHAQRRAAVTS